MIFPRSIYMHDHDLDLFATTMAAPSPYPPWTTGGLTPESPVLPISSPLAVPGSSGPPGWYSSGVDGLLKLFLFYECHVKIQC